MSKKDKTQDTVEPWRGIMSDVAKMMKAALKEADQIVTEYQRSQEKTREEGTDKTIEMAVAIFEATVTAEGGRRMIEAQQQNLVGGRLVIGHDGRKVRM